MTAPSVRDAPMCYGPLGCTGLKVSRIGVGGARFGAMLRRGTSGDVRKMLLEAFDRGITFYDTADSYGQGKSEELIGSTLKTKRAEIILATKTGYRLSAAGGFAAALKPVLRPFIQSLRPLGRVTAKVRASQMSQDFSPRYIRTAVEASLRRLQTEWIDLYQLHSPPGHILRRDEAFSSLEQLKSEGKIRHYGVSCLTVEDAVTSLQHPGVSAVQVAISLLERGAISQLLPLAREQNVAVIARQPFASGFLVASEGKVDSHPALLDREVLQKKVGAAANFRFLANGSRSMAQAAIQFVLCQDGVSVVLPGMSSIEHLRENLGALTAPPLRSEELSRIDALAADGS